MFFLCLAFSFSDVFAQKGSSYSLFQILYSGKKTHSLKKADIQSAGSIYLEDVILNGTIRLQGEGIVFASQGYQKEFLLSDSAVKKITLVDNSQVLNLVRLTNKDGKLWRLLKDTLGIRVYDKTISFLADGKTIDYESLFFEKGGVYKDAVTFWTTSTKKSIVSILNLFLETNLIPRTFHGKEELMDKFLRGDETVFKSR